MIVLVSPAASKETISGSHHHKELRDACVDSFAMNPTERKLLVPILLKTRKVIEETFYIPGIISSYINLIILLYSI